MKKLLLLGTATLLGMVASAAAADLEIENCVGPFCATSKWRPPALASLLAKFGITPIVHGHVGTHLATTKPGFTANMPIRANKHQAVHGVPVAEQ